MVFPKTTRSKHFLMYEHEAGIKADPLEIKKIQFPVSFMLETQTYDTFVLV
jgi:hypothetical protein